MGTDATPGGPPQTRRPGPGTDKGAGLRAVPPDPAAEALAVLTKGAETRRLRRHDVLFEEGDPAEELFVVQTGRLVLARCVDDREWFVSLPGAGAVLGGAGLFDGLPRSAQARALSPSTVLSVAYGPVRRLLEQRPALLWSMGRLLAGHLRDARAASVDLVSLDLAARTAKCVLALAGPADEFQLPLTQGELAAMVGASRERVNKAIAGFAHLGWLERRGRRYRILDREQLRRRAASR